ncbi:MAG TPA: polysaccharide pyruvyl transferase family protein [Kiritimatiellia bacterium]|nr:polysaccharide pyruvyl transferase family protein [Kiritimatiellia bacterium]HMO99118.1 polysaccharide pyruvyl transferase family protein [Kiritimatiellia bacterium]HMP95704.1 polysaccharide pyruvyl transferase family protein [Kiritimatiellia bacterium]
MRTITVLGNNSGRNAGDNAILGNLLDDFALKRSDIRFKVPTLSPPFIRRHFGHHNVKPVGLLPWNLAAKNFGLPLYLAMTRTELVLITDNILFDRKFHNPFVNNLNMISRIAPICKKKNIPVVFYNCSIGPVERDHGIRALRRVLDASPLVITRDVSTGNLLKRLYADNLPEVVMHADCALNTEPPSAARLDDIIRKEGLFTNPKGTIGLNVNAYIDDFNETGTINRDQFCRMIAKTADRLIEEIGVDILFTVSQIMDMKVTQQCVRYSRHPERIRVVGNCDYTYQELTGLLGKLDVHAGLRTHTLIFCAAVNTPMVNINAYPKSAGFMDTIGMGDWTIPIHELTEDRLTSTITACWNRRAALRDYMQPIVENEKKKARASVDLVSRILG